MTLIDSNHKNVNRRDFLKMCGMLTAAMALPVSYVDTVAKALAVAPRLPVVWMEFQGCTGDTESFIRAGRRSDPLQHGRTDPSITELVLDYISLEYHETLMAPSGAQSHRSLQDVLTRYPGQFVAVVEGSIPTAQNGIYCTVRGRTALSLAQEVLPQAKAVVALGTCSFDGGLSKALPDVTGAVGVQQAVPGLANLVNLPGCPANVANAMAVMVYLLTFDRLPDVDSQRRPLFAYGDTIHEECERKDYYENEMFVQAWGDAGHRAGWCLYKMGCKGPRTHSNCSQVGWNDNTCWPVAAGHGCIGCAEPGFWDTLTPVYVPLSGKLDD